MSRKLLRLNKVFLDARNCRNLCKKRTKYTGFISDENAHVLKLNGYMRTKLN